MNSCLPTKSKLVSQLLMAAGFAPCESLQIKFSLELRRNGLLVVARPLAKGYGLRGRKSKAEKHLKDNARSWAGIKQERKIGGRSRLMAFTASHLYFEDVAVDQEWESLGRTVTQADIVNFAGL